MGRGLRHYVPILEWLPRYNRADLPGDLIGGITVAALLIPQGMAYAQIAGLPPVTGLYASTVPILAYVVLARSTCTPRAWRSWGHRRAGYPVSTSPRSAGAMSSLCCQQLSRAHRLLESIGLVRNEAEKTGDRIDPNQELIALGVTNLSAGFFKGMVATGALTRTGVADQSGARTQLNAVVSVALVVLTALTFIATFVLGLEVGLLVAVAASLVFALEQERVTDDLDTVILDASGVDNLDSTAAAVLVKIERDYKKRGVRFVIDNVKDEVRDVMDAAGITSE